MFKPFLLGSVLVGGLVIGAGTASAQSAFCGQYANRAIAMYNESLQRGCGLKAHFTMHNDYQRQVRECGMTTQSGAERDLQLTRSYMERECANKPAPSRNPQPPRPTPQPTNNGFAPNMNGTSETSFRRIGAWNVVMNIENSQFNRCGGVLNGTGGFMRLNQHPNSRWFLTFPSAGIPANARVPGMLELGRASFPVTFVGGGRSVVELNGQLLNALRSGGYLSVNVNNKNFTYQLDNVSTVIGAVQDCVQRGRTM